MPHSRANTLVLFDVDGTLTVPRKEADPAMLAYLDTLLTSLVVDKKIQHMYTYCTLLQ